MSVCLHSYMSICLFLSTKLHVCMSVRLFTPPLVCLFTYVCLSCLFTQLSVCLFTYVCVCLFTQLPGGVWRGTYADPWVLEGLLRCDPLGRVDGQHLVDQVLGFRSHRVPLGRRELQRQTERLKSGRRSVGQTGFTLYIT